MLSEVEAFSFALSLQKQKEQHIPEFRYASSGMCRRFFLLKIFSYLYYS